MGNLLTPLQEKFLGTFFTDPIGQHFFLTGGTALAAFHLHHRLSDDLDLFTLDDVALEASVRPVEQIATDLKRLVLLAEKGFPLSRHAEFKCEVVGILRFATKKLPVGRGAWGVSPH